MRIEITNSLIHPQLGVVENMKREKESLVKKRAGIQSLEPKGGLDPKIKGKSSFYLLSPEAKQVQEGQLIACSSKVINENN